MADIDEFASSLLEEAKRFLEKVLDESSAEGQAAYLHAALNLAFCSLEAHINAIGEELASHREFFAPHDQGVLLEKEVRLDNGEFKVSGLKMYPLTDRIQFLYRRVTGKLIDKNARWWSELASAIQLRNKLTHPKEPVEINITNVERVLKAIIQAIDALYRGVYKTGLPAAGMGLDSKMNF
jgi:hypothetical protein